MQISRVFPWYCSQMNATRLHWRWFNVGSSIGVASGTLIARFMGPTWGPPGADRPQVGLMWATWTLLSGQQVVTWTKVDYIRWRYMASLGHNELTVLGTVSGTLGKYTSKRLWLSMTQYYVLLITRNMSVIAIPFGISGAVTARSWVVSISKRCTISWGLIEY